MGVTWFQFIMFLAIASSTGTCLMQTFNVFKKVGSQPGEFAKAIGECPGPCAHGRVPAPAQWLRSTADLRAPHDARDRRVSVCVQPASRR